jgi:protein-disulfide isomerase
VVLPERSRPCHCRNGRFKRAGMTEGVETCEEDQSLLDKLTADQKFAYETLKVVATPAFFINGGMLKDAMSFEEIDRKIKSLSKR